MPYVLVVSHDVNARRLLVDNLVRRSYLAVGLASLAEGDRLLQRVVPELIVLCGQSIDLESDVDLLRSQYSFRSVPIVLVSPDAPDYTWLATWHIDASLHYPLDFGQIVDVLQPWLLVAFSQSNNRALPPHY